MEKISEEVEKLKMHLRIISEWIWLYKGLSCVWGMEEIA